MIQTDAHRMLSEAILTARADAIVATDSDGIIQFWNPGAHRIFGFTADEAIGRSLDIIIPENLRARHWQGYRHVMATGTSRYGDSDTLSVPAITSNGRRISVEFTITVMKEPDGGLAGMVAVMRDVTERFAEIKALKSRLAAAGATAIAADWVQTYRAFAYNNAWANHRLLTACATLDSGDFAATRTSFFPSLQKTLNHLYVVDLFYVDALEGGSLGPRAWSDPVPCPTVAALQDAQAAIDRRLIAFCEALTGERLKEVVRVNRDERIQTERCDRLLMHLFQHQIHHRGQAHAMLAGTGVKPPQLDEFFPAGEATLRADDFEKLGWTEEMVWGG